MLDILYQDDHLIVLDKPSGLLAVPGRGPELQDCLSARAQAAAPSALVVHRLDRDTSGLMVMALTPHAQRELSRQFAERTVEKRYLAVVWGGMQAAEGFVDLPMRKDFERPPRHKIDLVDGRSALTAWRLVERLPAEPSGQPHGEQSRLEVRPLTGRSHQIRVHLATLGHPILGDCLYAHPAALALAPRLMLHAERLALAHPADGRPMIWTSACPF
ncbi:MAG TPA: RluA family pseudouridine synthase [Pirellulales bacterium]|nr:RluA family pseudouridine synthase [Pirellulales bacterium]